MPHAGLLGSHDGMDNIVGCVGPIARSARDLELFCRVMMQYEAWLLEHAVLEIPWNTEVAQGKTLPSKLSFAILWDDGVVKPHPPVTRELQRTKEALLKAGHEVIDWIPSEHQEGWDLIVGHPSNFFASFFIIKRCPNLPVEQTLPARRGCRIPSNHGQQR